MTRWLLMCVGFGTAIPLAFLGIYHLVPAFSGWWFKAPTWAGTVLLAIWPSSLLMIGDPEDKSLILPIIATVLNALLYGVVGALVRFGFLYSKPVLAVTVLAVLVGWFALARL